jgi:hypothetical protein
MSTHEKAKAWAMEARKAGMNDLAEALDRFADREKACEKREVDVDTPDFSTFGEQGAKT